MLAKRLRLRRLFVKENPHYSPKKNLSRNPMTNVRHGGLCRKVIVATVAEDGRAAGGDKRAAPAGACEEERGSGDSGESV